MMKPVDVLGKLSITGQGGEQLQVEGRGDTISVNLPNLWMGRSLAKQAPTRSKRRGAISKLHSNLQRADLTLQVQVGDKTIAYLTPHSKATLLSRVFGLGSVELKPLALLLAIFRRQSWRFVDIETDAQGIDSSPNTNKRRRFTDFVADKDESIIPFVLSQILDSCVNGIILSDPDQKDDPFAYANEAFELITGYSREDIPGHNCRFLQGNDRDQKGIEQIQQAMRDNNSVTVTQRNYRKNGKLSYNRFSIRPLFDRQGRLIYQLVIQYDVIKQAQADEELKRLNKLLSKVDQEN